MTPSDLIARAKDSFTVLFHNEPDKLRGLTGDALGVFQDSAGHLCRVYSVRDDLTQTEYITLPDDFLSAAMLKDANGQYHQFSIADGKLTPVLQSKSRTPFCLEYFFNFRGMDIALSLEDYDADTPEYTAGNSAVRNSAGEQFICIKTHDPEGLPEPASAAYDDTLWKPYNHIPQECVAVLLDYLVAVINLHNTERARGVNAATGIQEDLPSKSELQEAIRAVRERMEENYMVLPVCSVRE